MSETETLTFFVRGKPVPKGSMNGRVVHSRGRRYAQVYDQQGKDLKTWQEAIKWAAIAQRRRLADKEGRQAYKIRLLFQFHRPQSHTNAKGKPTADFRPSPTVKPDIDKLTRAVLDALSGTIYKDDSQVTAIAARKVYDSQEGVWIQIIPETE